MESSNSNFNNYNNISGLSAADSTRLKLLQSSRDQSGIEMADMSSAFVNIPGQFTLQNISEGAEEIINSQNESGEVKIISSKGSEHFFKKKDTFSDLDSFKNKQFTASNKGLYIVPNDNSNDIQNSTHNPYANPQNYPNNSNPSINDGTSFKSIRSRRTHITEISNNLQNFFYDLNESCNTGLYTFDDFENNLMENYTKIKEEFYFNNKAENKNKQIEKKEDEDVIIKMKIDQDFLESSVIISEPQERNKEIKKEDDKSILKKSSPENLDLLNDKNIKYNFIHSTVYYFEKIINIILEKYKPQILTEDGHLLKTSAINVNDVNTKAHNELNFLKFNYEMKELDHKITEKIAFLKIKYEGEEKPLSNVELRGDTTLLNLKELNFLNYDKSLLKKIIFLLYKYPYSNKHIYWKTYLLNVYSTWKYQKENYSKQKKQKLKIKYLRTKLILEKLINNKQSNNLDKYLNIERLRIHDEKDYCLKFRTITQFLKMFISENPLKLPFLTFIYDSTLMIIFDFIEDLHILFFVLVCPMWVVLGVEDNYVFFIANTFNVIHFFNIIRNFRRLRYNETKTVMIDMKVLFKSIILHFNMLIDFFTLIPFLCLYDNVTSIGVNTMYNYFFLVPALRLVNFGKSMEFLEKTKYAMFARLILLVLRFILFAHWMGLIYMQYVTFDYFDPSYFLQDSCKQLVSGQVQLTNPCKYIIALMEGTYLIPGGVIDNHEPVTLSDDIIVFVIFFIGQIIVAYIFGNVTQLIANLNQAANIYREKLDNVKSFNLFYNFEDDIKMDINIYYEYLWQKKRNHIYDDDLLSNISETLYVNIYQQVYPNYAYFLKDFIGISKSKEKKLISSLICNMKEYIAFPYERLYTQGHLVRGLFLLSDGTAIFSDRTTSGEADDDAGDENTSQFIRYDYLHTVSVKRKDYLEKSEFDRKYKVGDKIRDKSDLIPSKGENNLSNKIQGNQLNNSDKKVEHRDFTQTSFPLDSIFLKTGRAIETCYVDDFSDLFIIDLKFFDSKLIVNFPTEMQKLKEKAIRMGIAKIGENKRIQNLVFKHSARSVGSYYEENYDISNIWIDIKYKIPTIINENELNDNELEPFYGHSKGLLEFNFQTKFLI